MSMLASPPTADPFGIVGTFPAKLRRVASSTVNCDLISARIRQVLEAWESFAEEPIASQGEAQAIGSPSAVRPYPTTPLEAVEHLRDVLQISRDAVLKAVGIPERTFYGWQGRPETKPRAASLGALWSMVETLTFLERAHPNLAAWFHSTPAAQESFAAGQVNRLLQLELEWATSQAQHSSIAAPFFGDPGDALEDELTHEESADTGLANSAGTRAPTLRTGPRSRTRLRSDTS